MLTTASKLEGMGSRRRRFALMVSAVILLTSSWLVWEHCQRHPVGLLQVSGPIEGKPADLFVNVHPADDNTRVVVRDYFHSTRPLSEPYLTYDSPDSATLHLDVEGQFSWTSTKCELQRQIVVMIPSRLLSGRNRLNVFNHDSSSTGSATLGVAGSEAEASVGETFVEAKVAC